MKGLAGKTVLVSGGGGAIGAALCRRFAEAGASHRLRQKPCGRRARPRKCAVWRACSTFRALRRAKAAVGQDTADALVNNAGWEWEALIDINKCGPLNMHHLVVPGMVKRGRGRVINIASEKAAFITGQVISFSGGLTMAG